MSTRTARGVLLSLASSVFFGVLYYVMPWFAPLSGEAVWAIRVLFAVPTVTIIVLLTREWPLIGQALSRARQHPVLILGMLATAALLAAQIWVYMWAPLNGRALQVALGYFLFPLVMIVVGRLFYHERLTRLQQIATGLAAIGVVIEIVRVGSVSWEALLVALGYPLYFVIRKATKLNNTVGMWFDMLLMLPLAAVTVFASLTNGPSLDGHDYLYWFVPLIGVLSSVAILFFVLAGKYLSMGVFGLLSYVEPALLMIAALLIGETIAPGELVLYVFVWVAIALVFIDGIRQLKKSGRAARENVERLS